MVSSQELLEKYRAAEKAEKGEPVNPEQTNTETETTTPTETATPADANVVADATPTKTDDKAPAPSGEAPEKGKAETDDPWKRTQTSFEKRLHRQERSHRRQVDELNAKIAELEKQLKAKEVKLEREDFPSAKAYEDYRLEELKKSIIADNEKRQKEMEAAAARKAEADRKLDAVFKTPEAKADFQETLGEFVEDNGEWLSSEEGQLYQEIIDQSKVGLIMAMAIAKNPAVTEQMKGWSKDMLYHRLSEFEAALLQKAAQKQTAEAKPNNTPAEPTTKGIPSTGAVGKTQTPTTFNARDWLKKNRPERYK